MHKSKIVLGVAVVAIVRRQSFWNQWALKLRESSAHLFGLIMHPCTPIKHQRSVLRFISSVSSYTNRFRPIHKIRKLVVLTAFMAESRLWLHLRFGQIKLRKADFYFMRCQGLNFLTSDPTRN